MRVSEVSTRPSSTDCSSRVKLLLQDVQPLLDGLEEAPTSNVSVLHVHLERGRVRDLTPDPLAQRFAELLKDHIGYEMK